MKYKFTDQPTAPVAEEQWPTCHLCHGPVEPWPTEEGKPVLGWGNNPEPLGTVDQRVCNTCNTTRVIEARILELGLRKNVGRDG